jgi:hypothetical protein
MNTYWAKLIERNSPQRAERLENLLSCVYDKEESVAKRLSCALDAITVLRDNYSALKTRYDNLKSDISWERDQNSYHRMGL